MKMYLSQVWLWAWTIVYLFVGLVIEWQVGQFPTAAPYSPLPEPSEHPSYVLFFCSLFFFAPLWPANTQDCMLIKVLLTIDTGKLKAQTNGLGCAPSITLAEDSLFADFNLEELFPFLSCETHKSQADKKSQTELAKKQEALRFNKERLFCSAFLEV